MAFEYTVRQGTGAFALSAGAFVHFQSVEDFELGDLRHYCDPPASGSSSVVTGAARSGTYGLRQTDFDFIGAVEGEQSHPGPYPAPGKKWDVYSRFPTAGDADGDDLRFHAFGLGTTGACDTTDDMGHRFEVQQRALASDRLEIRDTVAGVNTGVDLTSPWPIDEWVRTRVEWDDSTSPNTVRAEPFDAAGNSLTGGNKATRQTDNMATNRGFGFRNSGGSVTHWDDLRLVP